MRLLLILALLITSVGMVAPVVAQAGEAPSHDHAAMEHAGHHDTGQDGDADTGSEHAAVHVCPGCALVDDALFADPALASAALPQLPANPASPASFDANPIPPPPRLA